MLKASSPEIKGLQIKFTHAEAERLEALAKSKGKPLAALLRRAALTLLG